MSVRVNINKAAVLRARGLGTSNAARIYLANSVKRFSDPYVPMQSSRLKNSAQPSRDGRQLIYIGPYAHYHWRGEAMGGRAPKRYTGTAMNYHGAPMRGKEWVNRAMNDHAKDVTSDVATYVGGHVK